MAGLQVLQQAANTLRHHIVNMSADSAGAHVGGSMSVVEILTVLLFDGVLRVDPRRPKMAGRDYLIFSKAHASAALYGALAERGFFAVEELETYKQMGSRLAGHPLQSIPGVELATGSLGHGLAVGNGVAMAGKHDHRIYRVFVVLGDGECQEGSVWEAAMTAAHYRLDNMVAIIDRNGVQGEGPTETIMALEPFADKWRDFNWEVREVDGHDVGALSEALRDLPFAVGRPSLLIARTVKGKGLSFTENAPAWHFGKMTSEQRAQALAELAASRAGEGRSPGARAAGGASAKEPSAASSRQPPAAAAVAAAAAGSPAIGSPEWIAAYSLSSRKACRQAQLELARVDERLFSIEGDLDTCGVPFQRELPGRFLQIGIAEGDMVGTAAGLALRGKLPFVNTFAAFLSMRACEQVRVDVAYPRANVKLVGYYAGISAGFAGPTHHCLEDLAILRSLPNLVILSPADAVEAYKATLAAAAHDGPVYLRVGRAETPQVYFGDYQLTIGKAVLLADGDDLALLATGNQMVAETVTAAARLREAGIGARVLNVHTVKPLDREAVIAAAATGAVVTVEEHSVLGGLGGAVAEVLAQDAPVPLVRVGMDDRFCEIVGSYEKMMPLYGLDAAAIVAAAHRALERKQARRRRGRPARP